jgi:nucleotide sugar dehydrogenase
VPEFVALGDVVRGLQSPPILLIGSDDADAGARAAALYGRIVQQQTPTRFLSMQDAELAKIALNTFFCLKISFGNFLAQLGDRLGGADLDGVADALSLDPRIGSGLLRGGTPYGGPCLPRDVDSLLHLSQSLGLDAPLAQASSDVNTAQYAFIERYVLACRPRRVAVLGLSFKPGTAVAVVSPAFEFVRRLQAHAIEVAVFDPLAAAREAARAIFGPTITSCDTLDESLRRADVILVCNPDPDFVAISAAVPADRHIVDPRGCVRGPHPGLKRPGRLPDARQVMITRNSRRASSDEDGTGVRRGRIHRRASRQAPQARRSVGARRRPKSSRVRAIRGGRIHPGRPAFAKTR